MGTTNVAVTQSRAAETTVQIAKSAIAERLKDPESLKIRRLQGYRTTLGDQIICGEYDAKNSFGGYGGYSMFYVRVRNGVIKAIQQDGDMTYFLPAREACRRAAAGSLPLPVSDVTG